MYCRSLCAWIVFCALTLACAARAAAQASTADLSGSITDSSGAGIKGAKVTATLISTGSARIASTDEAGHYTFLHLTPGTYKVTVEASGFKLSQNSNVEIIVGEVKQYDAELQIGTVNETTEVTAGVALLELQRSQNSDSVNGSDINSLPNLSGDYLAATRRFSQWTSDSAPSIGAAPTSGTSVGGQRARGNEISVDGGDAVDNSVNGMRPTVSQEAVEEYQIITSNYDAEYGRATGGVINIISKHGGNDLHGNVYGYFRHKDLQARNPFSVNVDPATGALIPVKQAFTRARAGATFGGPIIKDKTFYFLSYELIRREETGFTNIGENNFGLIPATTQFVPGATMLITPAQDQAVQQLLAASQATGNPALAQLAGQYEVFMGSASSVALSGFDFGAVATGLGMPTPPGAQFPIPVPCAPGQPLNNTNSATCSNAGAYVAPLPASFVPLSSLRGNYPVTEKTSLWSGRLDHKWTANNTSFLRVGVSPSLVTGIQVNAQNQNFGQNAGSRTSLQQTRDVSGVYQHDTIFDPSLVNEFRFQFARRGLHYGFSQLPGGSGPGVNIAGFAFFGREPFSTVDRIERRYQWTDSVTKTAGNHSFKAGVDSNYIQLDSKKSQIFELNFGSVINFGGLTASQVSAGAFPDSVAGINLPGTTGVQSYGLGLPTTFIQGIGNSNRLLDNKAFAGFAEDSWRMTKKITLNYGLRYDVELTPLFTPATAINQAAEKAFHVVEGIPRDYNNFAPRLGVAWGVNANTVVRAGYGLFYDHPLLAIGFNSSTAEGALSSQLLSAGGAPSACFLIPGLPGGCGGGDGPTNLNAASIFQGVLNATVPPGVPGLGYLASQERFDPKFPNSLFANQNFIAAGFPIPILPFTLPVAGNFQYAYAQQGNLTVEHSLSKTWKFSVGYQYTHGLHLNRPRDVNSTDPQLLDNNLLNAAAAGLSFSNPLTVVAPATSYGPSANSPCGAQVVVPNVLAQLANCQGPFAPLTGQYVSTPAVFNYFRPSGPNPSFAGPAAAGYSQLVGLAQLAGYPVGFGVPVPYNSVDQQESSGNSVYHGLTLNVARQVTRGFSFLSSYTWAHTIDDSTDLQTLLEPQDSRFPHSERANSDFDQRHRWVTSAIFETGAAHGGDSLWKHLTGGFTVSPIVELSSGRPYTVLTGTDFRLDLGAAQGRPSVGAGVSSPYIKGATFSLPTTCLTNSGASFSLTGIAPPSGCDGNLGRNTFVRPGFFEWDTRVARRFPLSEHLNLDAIVDMFNLFNRFNVGDVSPLCNPTDPAGCNAGQPTAALTPRTFQLALKLSW
jgi:Carboxypeptidase regulatory-like domain/TonB dependent receptor